MIHQLQELATQTGHLHVPALLLRYALATLLGALVALRPWRLLMGLRLPTRENAASQLLMSTAGAIVITIIGESLARAFGLVGLGGFIRFRSKIRDPRDSAAMFLLIGVGMACGLGLLPLAIAATGFICVILIVVDLFERGPKGSVRYRVRLKCDDPIAAEPAARAALARHVLSLRSTKIKIKDSEVRFEVDLRPEQAAGIPAVLREALGGALKSIETAETGRQA